MRICIDAGHGGMDPGAVGKHPREYKEKDFTLSVALKIAALLENEHDVYMTRRTDRTLGLDARARFANRMEAELYVSCHANAAATPIAQGIEVFHYPASHRGRLWAAAFQRELIKTFPNHRDRGVKEANFAVLRLTRCPAVLIEFEFISNPIESTFLAEEGNQQAMAQAVADTITADPLLEW